MKRTLPEQLNIRSFWSQATSILPREKKILEQLSRTQFFTEFENPAFFFPAEKRARISNPVKNLILESYSNVFFILIWLLFLANDQSCRHRKSMKNIVIQRQIYSLQYLFILAFHQFFLFFQIMLWEAERNRFTFSEGVLYNQFLSEADFEVVKQYAENLGVLIWANATNRTVVVTKEGHDPVKKFWKQQNRGN